MVILRYCLIVVFVIQSPFLRALDDSSGLTPEGYIQKYKNIAIKHMKKYGIPASITLAQGILESGFGNSDLAKEANNHFGIKCHKGWDGETYHMDDDTKDECFRKYKNAEQSFDDHAIFLTSYKRYAFLFDLKSTDYKGWAKGLKKAGYATNPKYAEKLIDLIKRYELYQYDKKGKKKGGLFSKRDKNNDDIENDHLIEINSRDINLNNRVKFVIIEKDESIKMVGDELDIRPWMLRKYNDLDNTDTLNEGDTLYIQSKKRNAETDYHIVKAGEEMLDISRKYAIKLKHLYKKNNMEPGTKPQPGEKLWLRKRKPSDKT